MSTLTFATVGGGCFWCTEAIFQEIKGVVKVVSGYTGGTVPGRPTYREICSGLTGHAEVVQISFYESVISYTDLLSIFMATHDPTSLNRQGADCGTQYRSVIFYHTKDQKQQARDLLSKMATNYDNPIVTELSPLGTFYYAEKEHQNYYQNNKEEAYCRIVISPKLKKLRDLLSNKRSKALKKI